MGFRIINVLVFLTIVPSKFINSFLLQDGRCFHDGHCGLGKCDTDNRCRCYIGWKGSFCGEHNDLAVGTTLNPCDHFICQHGTCHSYSGERKCQCDHQWSGIVCDIPFDNLCHQGNCHHGDCFNSKCYCHTGWSGYTCNVKTHEYTCQGQPCHHGNCEWSSNGKQTCRCFFGWTGQDCNTEMPVSYSHCGTTGCHHGKCTRYNYPYYRDVCQCYPGWRGTSCSQIDPRCFETYCFHGVCHYDLSRSEHYCICDYGWTGKDCNTREVPTPSTTTSTTRLPTTTKTIPSTTKILQSSTTKTSHSTSTSTQSSHTTTTSTQIITAMPLHTGSCSKVSVVSDIANSQISDNQNAVSCVSGNKTSPEALVLAHCYLTSPAKWREGMNVMANCSSIPPYTPIATFGSHRYSSAGTLCGIFIGCLQNGFQMAVQYCDQPPSIEHVETNNGLFARDPASYFTIME